MRFYAVDSDFPSRPVRGFWTLSRERFEAGDRGRGKLRVAVAGCWSGPGRGDCRDVSIWRGWVCHPPPLSREAYVRGVDRTSILAGCPAVSMMIAPSSVVRPMNPRGKIRAAIGPPAFKINGDRRLPVPGSWRGCNRVEEVFRPGSLPASQEPCLAPPRGGGRGQSLRRLAYQGRCACRLARPARSNKSQGLDRLQE